MRPLRALILYIFVVFVGGSLLAPWLYWLVQSVAPTFPTLSNTPFHRFVNRAFLILALVGLWPLLRALGAKSGRDVGILKPAGHWKELCVGLILGFLSLAIVAGIAFGFGTRVWSDRLTMERIFSKFGSAIATAAVVSVMEEILFRGGIFGGLRRVFNWRIAVLISSAIYAIVHFFAPARHTGQVVWSSGLALLPKMLAGFGNLHALVPGFFNLMLAGVLLALAFQRTGNLYFSIGLHAGWIFWLKSYGAFTKQTTDANIWLFGSSKLIDGWLACGVLAATLLLLPRMLKSNSTKPPA